MLTHYYILNKWKCLERWNGSWWRYVPVLGYVQSGWWTLWNWGVGGNPYSNKPMTYNCTTRAQNPLPPNLLLKTWLQFQVAHNPGYISPNTLVCTFKYRFTFLIISTYVMSTNEATWCIYIYIHRKFLLQDYNSPHVYAVYITPSSSGTTTSLFESFGLLNYFLPFNPILHAFCPITDFHNS